MYLTGSGLLWKSGNLQLLKSPISTVFMNVGSLQLQAIVSSDRTVGSSSLMATRVCTAPGFKDMVAFPVGVVLPGVGVGGFSFVCKEPDVLGVVGC